MSVEWSLVADIGGTNARFSALPLGALESEYTFNHSVEEHPRFSDLIVDVVRELIRQQVGIVRQKMPV